VKKFSAASYRCASQNGPGAASWKATEPSAPQYTAASHLQSSKIAVTSAVAVSFPSKGERKCK
jgi:hypothetical protein